MGYMRYVALAVESLNYGAGGPKPAHILLLLLLILLLLITILIIYTGESSISASIICAKSAVVIPMRSHTSQQQVI